MNPLQDVAKALDRRGVAWGEDRRRLAAAEQMVFSLREEMLVLHEVLNQKLSIIDTLTSTLDATVSFEAPHTAPAFARSMAMSVRVTAEATGAQALPVSPGGARHKIPAHRKNSSDTVRALQQQVQLLGAQYEGAVTSSRAARRKAQAFAARIMQRHMNSHMQRSQLFDAFSIWLEACRTEPAGESKRVAPGPATAFPSGVVSLMASTVQ